ncbi:hypothetical protein J2X83_001848 [Brevibacillus nitrificans]|nr:hypothetical protein [Brevibacillus nitrificans]
MGTEEIAGGGVQIIAGIVHPSAVGVADRNL